MLIKDIIPMQPTLANIVTQKLPFSLAYKFSKLAKVVDDNFAFYREQMQTLINECALKDDKGEIVHDEENSDIIKLNPDMAVDFDRRAKELQEVEITDEVPTFKFTDFEDKIELTTQEVITLMPVIVEE